MTKQPIKRTVAELPAHEMRRNGAVNKCVNLRHTELCGDEALSVAPQPEKLCDYPLPPCSNFRARMNGCFIQPRTQRAIPNCMQGHANQSLNG